MATAPRALVAYQILKMPTTVDEVPGDDGDNLVVEGVDRGVYHVVDRRDADPDYEKLCFYILQLSCLDVKDALAEYH